MQAVANAGLRAADWPEEVEGTYLRMDIPGIVPRLLQQLEQHKPGLGSRINHELVLYTGTCAADVVQLNWVYVSIFSASVLIMQPL